MININVSLVENKTIGECKEIHLEFGKDVAKEWIEELFGETKEGIIAHEHDDRGRFHY